MSAIAGQVTAVITLDTIKTYSINIVTHTVNLILLLPTATSTPAKFTIKCPLIVQASSINF